ncbi:hypothetical protein DFH27DRAFT_576687 [Peziza echinospora]|nr:hypothetical protein DFH27DRAFT_576687 [Peziza echinospora]
MYESLDGVQSAAMNGRSSFSTMTPRQSVDEKCDLTPQKEKALVGASGFKSFFSRLGAKRLSLPQLSNVDSSHYSSNSSSNNASAINSSNGNTFLNIPASIPSPLSPTKSFGSSKHQEAPALFIAYPHAIKAASLAALTVSSDTILRRNMELKAKEKKAGKPISQRTRAYSKNMDMEWTQKMFLLVPSMLLQYNGDGAVDRMPEKILQLTATSVAFASDVITGRPYVLQVSQSANADGSPITDDKKAGSIMLKLPWKNSSKNVAMSFLLVFDTAKEMDSWMGCIRIETAKLAGTWVPEKEDNKADEVKPRERVPRAISRRITIRREEDDVFDPDASHRFSRYSRNSRASLDAGTASTAISAEQVVLDRLRGSRSHLSMHSNSRTGGGSPETSPERYSDRRKSILSSPSRSRSSMELRNGSVSGGNEQIPVIHQSRTSSPDPTAAQNRPTGGKRLSSCTVGLRVQTPSIRSGHRNSVYSTMSTSDNGSPSNNPTLTTTAPTPTIGSWSNQRRGSYSKPDLMISTVGAIPIPTARPSLNTSRARPTSMIDARQHHHYQSYDNQSRGNPYYHGSVPSYAIGTAITTPFALSMSQPASARNLQRRSMTALGSRPDYGVGPPAFPPPQIPLPKLPQEGYDIIQARRRSVNQQEKRRSLRQSSSLTLGGADPNGSTTPEEVVDKNNNDDVDPISSAPIASLSKRPPLMPLKTSTPDYASSPTLPLAGLPPGRPLGNRHSFQEVRSRHRLF